MAVRTNLLMLVTKECWLIRRPALPLLGMATLPNQGDPSVVARKPTIFTALSTSLFSTTRVIRRGRFGTFSTSTAAGGAR